MSQELEKKLFVTYWDEGYNVSGEGMTDVHDEEWFTEELGYEEEERAKIHALQVGEIAKFYQPLADHWVIRVR